MQPTTQRWGLLAILAALVACATSACHTDDDQSSGGPSGETTASIVTPHIRLMNDRCHATGVKHNIYVKVSGLSHDKEYRLSVHLTSADKKSSSKISRTMYGMADAYGNGSYVISCERNLNGSYALTLAQDGINATEAVGFQVV